MNKDTALALEGFRPIEGWDQWEDEYGYVLRVEGDQPYIAVFVSRSDDFHHKRWCWNIVENDIAVCRMEYRGGVHGYTAMADAIHKYRELYPALEHLQGLKVL